ncbi:alpha/beta fold hydrolase [Halococcus sp. IIIV-5B]|uniref:alpha/beta fold hydrolase n=1 Tax=Halococcus sp. IIIV-5B TaxID=2321230 RepID=UPI000E72A595|nr:alpha/beta hydrolase [Halococcus sp. IIIV-5B]RJT07061.1 alpha/beta hydrolase [Halococcus sp. IIIV-5B]
MGIYHSQTGRQALETWYSKGVDQLNIDIEEQWIETRYGDTHVLLAGPQDGHPVIVFHGGNTTAPMVLEWYTELATSYRLIAPDTVGHPGKSAETRLDPQNDSYGEWVVDLLDAFDLSMASMIGTSYGGGIVLRTAVLAPNRIEHAALVVPTGFGSTSLLSLGVRLGLPSILYRIYPHEWLLNRVLAVLATQSDLDPVVRNTIAASLRYVKLERKFPEADASELIGFEAPTALFVSENDPLFPADLIIPRALKRLSRLTRIEIIYNEKHLLSPAAQRKVGMSIDDFFRHT